MSIDTLRAIAASRQPHEDYVRRLRFDDLEAALASFDQLADRICDCPRDAPFAIQERPDEGRFAPMHFANIVRKQNVDSVVEAELFGEGAG